MISAPVEQGPKPQGRYVVATRQGNLIFTAGLTPRRAGELILEGPVRSADPPERYRSAFILACSNALDAAKTLVLPGEAIKEIVSMTVFIAADNAFRAHSQFADFASEYLFDRLGDGGLAARAAVGVASLPDGAPVEIQLVAAVK